MKRDGAVFCWSMTVTWCKQGKAIPITAATGCGILCQLKPVLLKGVEMYRASVKPEKPATPLRICRKCDLFGR